MKVNHKLGILAITSSKEKLEKCLTLTKYFLHLNYGAATYLPHTNQMLQQSMLVDRSMSCHSH